MNIPELYELFLKYPKITTDSRNIPEKSIFWALKGEKFNGNKFADAALKSGASYAIIDDEKFKTSDKTILIQDGLKTLQLLANYHRKQLKLPILALTGTNGKTTTKELINAVLSTQYNIKATKGNLNNHIGVPLTILTFNESTEIGITEMGANHPGEIKQLCEIAEPDFGLITNIGKAHLEGFGSFETIIKTKSELYQSIIRKGGTIFYNSDNSVLKKLKKGNKTISYGTNTENYLKGRLVSANPYLSVEIETFEGVKTEINTKLIGVYNFENILAAACIGDFFNISIQNIKKAVENYIPDNNRSQFIKTENNEIILDAYNANPTSMKASIENFLKLKSTDKVLILGDMYELGKYSKEEHLKILQILKKKSETNESIKQIIVIGKYFKEAYSDEFKNSKIIHLENTKKTETFLRNNSYNNNMFLIKGSRAMRLESLVKYIK